MPRCTQCHLLFDSEDLTGMRTVPLTVLGDFCPACTYRLGWMVTPPDTDEDEYDDDDDADEDDLVA